jgi:hypothetical protein
MKLVIIESPYAGDVAANVAYGQACIRDSLQRGEAPFASHLFYTQPGVMDDGKPEERRTGIAAGHAWMRWAEGVVAYIDRGISPGMQSGINTARAMGLPVEFRKLSATEPPLITPLQAATLALDIRSNAVYKLGRGSD